MSKKLDQERQTIRTRKQAETFLGLYVDALTKSEKLKSELEHAIQLLRKAREAEISNQLARLRCFSLVLKHWAEANPQEFDSKKSIDFLYGRIGFRTSPPSLKTRSKVTWDKVVNKLLSLRLWSYVRVTHEADKEALMRDLKSPIVSLSFPWPDEGVSRDGILAELGLRIHQGEEFYIEPKSEKGDA